MILTLERYVQLRNSISVIESEQDRNDLVKILEQRYLNDNELNTTRKQKNTSMICQLDPDTFEVINKFKTVKEANTAFGIAINSSSISDATRGRVKSHFAYGYRWARENVLEEAIEEMKDFIGKKTQK